MTLPLRWQRAAHYAPARPESRLEAHARRVHAMLISTVASSLALVAICAYVLTHTQ